MKKLLIIVAAMLVATSCYKDNLNKDYDRPTINDVLTHMSADQSRIIRYNPNTKNLYSIKTFAAENFDAEHPMAARPEPQTPAPEAEPSIPANAQDYNDALEWTGAETVVVRASSSTTVVKLGNIKNLYIEKSGVKLEDYWGNQGVDQTIYVLSGADLDISEQNWDGTSISQVKSNVTFKVWGSIGDGKALTINDGGALYFYGDTLRINGLNFYGGKFYCYGDFVLDAPAYDYTVDSSKEFYCYGNAELKVNSFTVKKDSELNFYGTTSLETNEFTLESEAVFKWWDSLKINGAINLQSNSKFYYYGSDELEIGGYGQSADKLNVWFECHSPLHVHGDMSFLSGEYWFGGTTVIDGNFTTDADRDMNFTFRGDLTVKGSTNITAGNYKFYGETVFEGSFDTSGNYSYFEFDGPTEFKDTAFIRYGELKFNSSVVFEKLEIDNGFTENPTRIYLNGCSTLKKFVVDGNNKDAFHLYATYFLELLEGVDFQNGSNGIYHLNNGVLVIHGEADKDLAGHNVFVNGHFVLAEGHSAVFIQGSITGVQPTESERVFKYFRTKGLDDKLAVFGKRTVTAQGLETAEPVIYVGWASNGGSYVSDGYNTVFDKGKDEDDDYGYSVTVVSDPTQLGDDFVIDSKEEGDCRADFTWGTQPPTQDEILPPAKHKYSATSLDFCGNYVYICWHSNLPGGESQDDGNGGSFDHDHGTNMDPDREGEGGYGGPSVDDDEDWGGIIDIVQIDNYHPDNAELYIASTVWNPEHKYNHVRYYGNKLYLASTSWYVGAALHVVPLVPSETGVGQTFDSPNSYRVSLTGKSANCVEIVDDKSIVTISGRSEGGLNWFALDDVTSQAKKYKNGSTVDYGGKYIYDDGRYIYALHNTDNATVTTYDRSGSQIDELATGVALVPYDGKNAMIVKDGNVYICCGRNGLHVFDLASGEKVGQSKLAANSVDVDDNGYIYVATGSGLAVFRNGNQKSDGSKEYNTINYVAYTGKGFVYPNGWEKDGTMPDGTAKQSSNFVRVNGGKVFIAYGMYGLRIYSVSELTNPR